MSSFLFSTSVPNLVGGVSQQPPALRLPNQAQRQENALPSAFEGLAKRPPSEHIATLVDRTEAAIHVIDRDATERYVCVFGRTGATAYLNIYDINGTAKTVHTPDGLGYINEAGLADNLRFLTVADVTFVLNRNKTVTAGAAVSPWSRNTATKIPEALVWIRQTNYKRHFEIKITKGGTTRTYFHQTGSGSGDDIGTEEIAAQLASSANSSTTVGYASNPLSNLTLVRSGNILWFYGASASDTFDIQVTDDFGGEAMSLATDSVIEFDSLPDYAPHGYLVKVLGNGGSSADDYWVRFVQNRASPSTSAIYEGYWREDVGPNQAYQLNASTMPHVLIRESNGDFRFKQADGLNTYPDFKWASRIAGDSDSAPLPIFVGQKIRDMNFFKDRLVLLSGEYISLSETGQYFNFFPTTVQEVLDTATIEVGSTSPQVMDFKSSVVYSDRLVAFSLFGQITLRGEPILSPKTVSLTPSAAFENADCRPISSGTSIFFAFNRGSYSGIREMFISNNLELQFDAVDLTAQVPQYLNGRAVKLAASTHENFVVALCDNERSSLFVYKYFNQGDNRVQSAWSKFTFRDSTILDIQFLDTDLYVVSRKASTAGNQLCLERIRLESGRVDPNSTYITSLDRRVGAASLSPSYNAGTDTTTYTLPYNATTNAQMRVVTTTGLTLQTTQVNATTLRVPGNFTSNVWAGDLYTMLYEFSEPNLRSPSLLGGVNVNNQGRFQLRYGTISYGDSAYFNVRVQIEGGNTYEYPFTGRILGSLNNTIGTASIESGNFRFPIYSRNNQVKISVVNDSPLPSNLLSAEWESLFSSRSVRR